MTTKKTYPDKDTRLEQKYRKLGTREPICAGCGYRKSPYAFEHAHVVPRKYGDETVLLCRNCHREQSDGEKDHSYEPTTANPKMETIGRYLVAVADFLKMIANTLADYGAWLMDQAKHVLPYEPEAQT